MSVLTVQAWIHELETCFSFSQLSDSSDPFIQAMATFQSFTNDIASALRNDISLGTKTIDLIALPKIYDDLPLFLNWKPFRDWVKDATLKHRHRRTSKQYQWLRIVDMQERKSIDLAARVRAASELPAIWELDAYATNNLLVDPHPMGFFHGNHGIKDAEGDKGQFGESCLICTNDFDAGCHLAQRAPCGHHQCRKCFQEGLKHAAATYVCAFCRACLVCGRNNCQHHVVLDYDEVPPRPLQNILRDGHYLCGDYCVAAIEPLCGLTPKEYWALREGSRRLRSRMTRVSWLLSHDLAPEHRTKAEQELRDLSELLKLQAKSALYRQLGVELAEEANRSKTLRGTGLSSETP